MGKCRRQRLDHALGLLSPLISVIHPAKQRGECPTRVCEKHLYSRQFLEDAAEDEPRDTERRLKRHTHNRRKIVLAHPVLADREPGMHEYGKAQLFGGGEDLDVLRRVEILSGHVCARLDDREAELLYPLELSYCVLGRLHRYRSGAGKLAWILSDDRRYGVILYLGPFGSGFCRTPVAPHDWHGRKKLMSNSLPLHVFKPAWYGPQPIRFTAELLVSKHDRCPSPAAMLP